MAKYYFSKSISHQGLNKYKTIKAENQYELTQKVLATQAQWDEQWKRKCEMEKRKQEKEQIKYDNEQALAYAEKLTRDAELIQDKISNLLKIEQKELYKNDLYDLSTFDEPQPQIPNYFSFPIEPHRTDASFNAKMPFLANFSKNKKDEYIKKNDEMFQQAYSNWLMQVNTIKQENAKKEQGYQEELNQWNKRLNEFNSNKEKYNKDIDIFFSDLLNGDKEAIERFYSLLLNRVELPFLYDREVETEYISDSKILIIDMTMPTVETLPNLKKITYVKSTGEYKETYQSETYMKKLYDKVIYDMVLISLSLSFKEDKGNHIQAIVLNGKVNTIDRTTGKEISPYILSVNIAKDNFKELNLEYIDSREWFKSSKGISAATFAKVTPVAPVIRISHEDKRFIEGYDVVNNIDDSVNLAAIDWQDFENLIREIFEQEFNANGGEVKITQASRDGGVDAIAFDPDPIRGGKIVIQAKRYTNVVGVSAVRDLYGTVMNEGATKGILVTTSNYGNDAYEFAKGKPLTLMNGANLLFLLEKHGHKAKIDLAEAKEILKSE